MKNFKKILALVLVVIMALGVGSMALADGGGTELPDLILDGGEDGGSTMIKHFDPPTSRGHANDLYKYMGWASLLDSVPDTTIADGNYRYLVMTYTGDITQLRFEFTRMGTAGDGSDDEKEGPYWFNPEGQTYYFVTADESPIPLVGNNTTIVIDLAKTVNPNAIDGSGKGVGLDWYNSGIHMHCDEMVIHGNGEGFDITNAYLTTTLPEPEPETTAPETTAPETTAPETTAPETTAPETTAPATTAPETTAPATTEEATTEAASSMEAIILDGGEEGKSTMIKHFTNANSATDTDVAYKYLGYVTFKDLANENYKYLALTFTGDITNLRLQFVHNAGQADEEMTPPFWFNPEGHDPSVDPTVDPSFVTPDGSPIPLVGDNTTIFIDLEQSEVGMDWYNAGLHMHVNDLADIDITYAALLTELPGEDETLPVEDTVTAPSTEGTTTAAAGTGSGSPATGDVSPIVVAMSVCVLSLVVLGGALVVRRRY